MLGAISRMSVLLGMLFVLQGCERRPDAAAAWYPHEPGLLRVRPDPQRERLWLLTHQGISVYSTRTRQRIRQIALPGWYWAGEPYSCGPDLALGPDGEALVTSDIAASLWQVDRATFEVTRRDLDLSADRHMDVGFSGLSYSPERDAYFAVSYVGSLWLIEPPLSTARKIPLSEPLPGACGIATRPALCVSGELTDWLVELPPDLQAGRVKATPLCARQGTEAGAGSGRSQAP